MGELLFTRLDIYIIGIIQLNGFQYVCDNYIDLRNEYYINKNGG
jgi:hypothetical protein